MFNLPVFFLGAFAYRIRGGLLKDGYSWVNTTHGRWAWALAMGMVFFACTLNLVYSVAVVQMAYVGTLHGYLKGKFDLMREENRTVINYAWLSLAAMLRIAPIALVFSVTEYFSAFMFGMFGSLIFVPAYLAGNALYRKWPIMGHTQYGEAIVGGFVLWCIYRGLV